MTLPPPLYLLDRVYHVAGRRLRNVEEGATLTVSKLEFDEDTGDGFLYIVVSKAGISATTQLRMPLRMFWALAGSRDIAEAGTRDV